MGSDVMTRTVTEIRYTLNKQAKTIENLESVLTAVNANQLRMIAALTELLKITRSDHSNDTLREIADTLKSLTQLHDHHRDPAVDNELPPQMLPCTIRDYLRESDLRSGISLSDAQEQPLREDPNVRAYMDKDSYTSAK